MSKYYVSNTAHWQLVNRRHLKIHKSLQTFLMQLGDSMTIPPTQFGLRILGAASESPSPAFTLSLQNNGPLALKSSVLSAP